MNLPLSGTAAPRVPSSLGLLGLWKFVAGNVNKGPFIAIHLALIAVFFVPFSWSLVGLCAATYFIRMFGITAGYHRLFSHRAYKSSRWFQFVMAWLGCSAMQKGPLWWASRHRDHHKYSDQEDDPHSPVRHGIWWSHIGWILSNHEPVGDPSTVKDWNRYPELVWLERLHWIPGLVLGLLCYAIAGWPGVVWGFVVSTVLVYHGTFLVNSVCHVFGKRRYKTTDDSRNNLFVAIVTLGEGWHNNHHHYMSSANQGFFWWEIDLSYYILWLLSWGGVVWDLRKPPAHKLIPTT